VSVSVEVWKKELLHLINSAEQVSYFNLMTETEPASRALCYLTKAKRWTTCINFLTHHRHKHFRLTKSSLFWDITPCCPVIVKLTFRRNISLLSSGSKNMSRKKQAWSRQHSELCLLPVSCWFITSFAVPEDGGDVFLWNFVDFQLTTGCYILENTTLLLFLLLTSCWLLPSLIYPKDGSFMFFQNSCFPGMHGVISHKTEFFIATAVRSSNPNFRLKVLSPN
jgi:hypothetical protein